MTGSAGAGRPMILTPRGLLAFGRLLPARIGRAGVVPARAKREGDGATPAGQHRVTGCLYRPDRMPRPAPWARPIRPRDLWCDDPGHPLYNAPARAPLEASAESLRRPDPLYDLILTTDWNAACAPGEGSAIFLHRRRGPGSPTAGCIALPAPALRWLAARARPGTRLIVPPALAR